MISDKKCIACQGGVPPLNKDEINNFIKELDSNWIVYKDKEIRRRLSMPINIVLATLEIKMKKL